jgi:hypothetical protein
MTTVSILFWGGLLLFGLGFVFLMRAVPIKNRWNAIAIYIVAFTLMLLGACGITLGRGDIHHYSSHDKSEAHSHNH